MGVWLETCTEIDVDGSRDRSWPHVTPHPQSHTVGDTGSWEKRPGTVEVGGVDG